MFPDPRCIYQNAHKLPAAHTLSRCAVVTQAGRLPSGPYWDVRFTNDNPIKLQDAQAELRVNACGESVRLRMIADVPLAPSRRVAWIPVPWWPPAACPDAGAIICSIRFDDPRFDESSFAQQVADRYRTDHRLISSAATTSISSTPWLGSSTTSPLRTARPFPRIASARWRGKHVTVALSGDGGDESMAGYRRYRMHLARRPCADVKLLALRAAVIMFRTHWGAGILADWRYCSLRAKTTPAALAMDTAQCAYCHSMSQSVATSAGAVPAAFQRAQFGGYGALEVFRLHAEQAQTEDPFGPGSSTWTTRLGWWATSTPRSIAPAWPISAGGTREPLDGSSAGGVAGHAA